MTPLQKLASTFFLTAVSTAAVSHGAVLLTVDLSVPNTITIAATSGASSATVFGSTFTGVYLDGFFGISGSSLTANLISGDLTSANNPSDNSPSLFRAGSGEDPGLNVWSFSTDGTASFTVASLAFTGQASWSVSDDIYAEALSGPMNGSLYFPADDLADLAGATEIGTWTKSSVAAIPEPSHAVLLTCIVFGAFSLTRTRTPGLLRAPV